VHKLTAHGFSMINTTALFAMPFVVRLRQ